MVLMASVKSGKRIVKASGETEFFDPNVITTECREAGIEFWTAAEVALKVSETVYDGISTGEIRKTTLDVLAEISPEVADTYSRFHSMRVRTSRDIIEAFDRKKIALSLIRETRLPKEVAEQIARETESELRRLKLEFGSAPLIREVVNVKLLEHGFEEARADYTRLGVPIYDVSQLLEATPEGIGVREQRPEDVHSTMAGTVLKEYTLLKVLPLHLADAHMKGEIYVHKLDCFVTQPYSAQHDLRWFLRNGIKLDGSCAFIPASGPANSLETALRHAATVMAVARSNFSGMQCMDFFNVWLAPFVTGRGYDQVKQLAQEFMYEMGQMSPVSGGNLRPSSIVIEYGVPDLLNEIPAVLPGGKISKKTTYSDFEEEARLLGKALTEVSLDGDFVGKPFLSPTMIYRLRDEDLKKDGYHDFMKLVHSCASKFGNTRFINLRAKHMEKAMSTFGYGSALLPDEGDLKELLRAGSLQLVTINLPRIAYKAKGSDTKFFELLDDHLPLVRETIEVKREILRNRIENNLLPFLGQEVDGEPYFNIDKAFNLVGYVGLNETVEKHVGGELHASEEALKFGLKIIKYMDKKMVEWSKEQGVRWALAQTPEGDVSFKLAKRDFGSFSDKAIVRGDRKTGRVYYTPSSQVNESAPISPLKRLEIEGAFHPLTPGGMDAWIDVGENEADSLVKLTEEVVQKTGVGFFRYVREMTHCSDCRKVFAGHFSSCPKCESSEIMCYPFPMKGG